LVYKANPVLVPQSIARIFIAVTPFAHES